MHQWMLVFDTKPLPEPLLSYCPLDPQKHTLVKFKLKKQHFSFGKWVSKCCPQNIDHFIRATHFGEIHIEMQIVSCGKMWFKMLSAQCCPFCSGLNMLMLDALGAVSIRKTVLLGMAIPMLKIRRPTGRLIFNMGIPIPGKTVFYIETGPWYLYLLWCKSICSDPIPGQSF